MTATELLQDLREKQIVLTTDGGSLRYDAPEDAVTPDVLHMIRQHKTALLALLSRGDAAPAANDPEASLGNALLANHPEPCPHSRYFQRTDGSRLCV